MENPVMTFVDFEAVELLFAPGFQESDMHFGKTVEAEDFISYNGQTNAPSTMVFMYLEKCCIGKKLSRINF